MQAVSIPVREFKVCPSIVSHRYSGFRFPHPHSTDTHRLFVWSAFCPISDVVYPFQKEIGDHFHRCGDGIIVASLYVAFLGNIYVGEDSTQYPVTFLGVPIAANAFTAVAVLI